MPFTDRLRLGSVHVEQRNLPARFNPQRLKPRKGQGFSDWVGGIDIATQPTGIRDNENWPLEDRTMRQRILRAKSPMVGQRIKLRNQRINQRIKLRRFSKQRLRSKRFRQRGVRRLR